MAIVLRTNYTLFVRQLAKYKDSTYENAAENTPIQYQPCLTLYSVEAIILPHQTI